MLNSQVRILNFDNSLIRQNTLIEQFHPVIIDLQKIASCARIWLNKKTENKIKEVLRPEIKNAITFLGSGDFHHISSLLVEQFQEPITVIVFDNHPDWDTLPPKTGCGSWVSRILKKPNVKKVILLGISSGDIASFNIQTGNLAALENNRLEIYPYQSEPTKVVLKKVASNVSIEVKKGLFSSKIRWQQLKEKDLAQFSLALISRLETKQVYVSIDKDCLKAEFALTNWEAGDFSLDELLIILKAIKEHAEIAGLDITGEYSPVEIKGRIKSFCSRLDHPKDYSAKDKPDSLINSVNEQVNIRILGLLKSP